MITAIQDVIFFLLSILTTLTTLILATWIGQRGITVPQSIFSPFGEYVSVFCCCFFSVSSAIFKTQISLMLSYSFHSVFILPGVSIALKTSFGFVTNQYAWVVTVAFMEGQAAAWVVVALLVIQVRG